MSAPVTFDEFELVYEQALAFVGHEPYLERLAEAKAEFFALYGECYDEEPAFENYLATFNEWFLFENRIGKQVAADMILRCSELSTCLKEALMRWRGGHLMFAKVKRAVGTSQIEIRNMLTGQDLSVGSSLWSTHTPPKGRFLLLRPLRLGHQWFVSDAHHMLSHNTSTYISNNFRFLAERYGDEIIHLMTRLHLSDSRYTTLDYPERIELVARTLPSRNNNQQTITSQQSEQTHAA